MNPMKVFSPIQTSYKPRPLSIITLAALVAGMVFAQSSISRAESGDSQPRVLWVTESTPQGFSGPVSGVTEAGWVTLLQNAGYTVESYNPPGASLPEADITTINTYDLIILGRAINSTDLPGDQWNTRIRKPLITISCYVTRSSRLGWFMNTNVCDGMPTTITASTLTDPAVFELFRDVEVDENNTTLELYDEAYERNTSHVLDDPVPGGKVLAKASFVDAGSPTMPPTLRENVPVIVEFPVGTAVRGRQDLLGGYRMYFSAGSRELNQAPLRTAGKENLTETGEAMFLRAVAWAMQPRELVCSGPVQGPNGHFYEVILSPGLTWDTAKGIAEQRSLGCYGAHLATITSEMEDVVIENLRGTFLAARGLTGISDQEAWVGGYQVSGQPNPGDGWYWVNNEGTFPGVNGGTPYANWIEPSDGGQEPNDSPSLFIEDDQENHLTVGRWGTLGWNDEGSISKILGFIVEYEDIQEPVVDCQPTSNPSGKNVPDASGNPKHGGNPDGFYALLASDGCDPAPMIYISDSASGFIAGPFASGDKVKITQAPGVKPNQKPGAGVIAAHIQINGDAVVYAVDSSGNTSQPQNCSVPPQSN